MSRPAYETQSWPRARRLVWAQPGRGGDAFDPTRWRDGDRSAARGPDRATDIVLPDADTPYTVRAGGRGGGIEARHVTIGRNALLLGYHFAGEVGVWGNVEVAAGGRIHFVRLVGPGHTHFRLEGGEFTTPGRGASYGYFEALRGDGAPPEAPLSSLISHRLQIVKYPGSSVEMIGNLAVGDEVTLQGGTLVLSGELRYNAVPGKGRFEVFPGTTLEIQSGGTLAPYTRENLSGVYNVQVHAGATVRGGSDARPLAADACLLLGFADHPVESGRTGLHCDPGARIEAFTRDPARARLVVSSITSRPRFADTRGEPLGAPDTPARGARGIVALLPDRLPDRGLHLDYAREYGIRVSTAQRHRLLGAATFGPHCAGPAERLVAARDGDGSRPFRRPPTLEDYRNGRRR